jgi:hypothetical protein
MGHGLRCIHMPGVARPNAAGPHGPTTFFLVQKLFPPLDKAHLTHHSYIYLRLSLPAIDCSLLILLLLDLVS